MSSDRVCAPPPPRHPSRAQVHIPIDATSKAGKGFAYVLFLLPEHAVKALTALDGQIFQVRGSLLAPAQTAGTAC